MLNHQSLWLKRLDLDDGQGRASGPRQSSGSEIISRMSEDETSGLTDLLRPDTTWEAYFQVKLETDDEPPEAEVSRNKEKKTPIEPVP